MSNAISVSIKMNNPCNEDWNGMEPTEQGRFCNSCQKPVIDFTNFTDQQLLEYFLQHPFPVCGRMMHTQNHRHYSPSTLPKNRHLSPVAATLLTLATITSEAACSEAERVKPLQEQSVDKQTPGVLADSVIISGTVKDAHGNRLENVEIIFDKYKTLTDKRGKFQFTFFSGSLKPGVIQFSYEGLERQVRSYYPMMGSTSYEVQFPKADFTQFMYGGSIGLTYHLPVPDSLSRLSFQSLNRLSQKARFFLGNLAGFIKDNPNIMVRLGAYYKTSRQNAVKLQHKIKSYLEDKEGISEERFELAKPQLRKRMQSEVVIEFSPPDE